MSAKLHLVKIYTSLSMYVCIVCFLDVMYIVFQKLNIIASLVAFVVLFINPLSLTVNIFIPLNRHHEFLFDMDLFLYFFAFSDTFTNSLWYRVCSIREALPLLSVTTEYFNIHISKILDFFYSWWIRPWSTAIRSISRYDNFYQLPNFYYWYIKITTVFKLVKCRSKLIIYKMIIRSIVT